MLNSSLLSGFCVLQEGLEGFSLYWQYFKDSSFGSISSKLPSISSYLCKLIKSAFHSEVISYSIYFSNLLSKWSIILQRKERLAQ